MHKLLTISAADAVARLADFDTVIDARSEDEYALDRLPGAVNWPTLNNAERIVVGTTYVQDNPFKARKIGAVMAARNIAQHIETHALDKPKHWQPLLYCWRGGQRSGSLALVLSQIGFRVTLVEGGYKAFRAAMLQDMESRIAPLQFQVICGRTGSGKTRLLQALAAQGAQVLDLEALACHRSSVLGALPGTPQPTQKHFDMRVWDALRQFDPARPVFVESESKKVGNVAVSPSLMAKMRAAPCLHLQLPIASRVQLLLEDYVWFTQHKAAFCERLDVLAEFRGKALVAQWKEKVAADDFAPVVHDLLTLHYDPGYLQSSKNNFRGFESARALAAQDHGPAEMARIAAGVLADAGVTA